MVERKTVQTHLHFDLGFVAEGVPVTLQVGKDRLVLNRHTPESRATHRSLNCALQHIPDQHLTHYVENVHVSESYAQLLLVTAPSKVPGAKLNTLLLTAIHVPKKARIALHERHRQTGDPRANFAHPKFAKHGVKLSAADDPSPIIDVHDYKTAFDAAVAICFHHAEMVNIGGNTSATVTNIIEYSNGISDLAEQIYFQALQHQKDPTNQNWTYETPYLDPNFKPTDSNYYNWSDITKQWTVGPMSDSLKKVKNEPSLESTQTNAGTYTVQDGTTQVTAPQSTSYHPMTRRLAEDSSSSYWTVNSLTPLHGFSQSGDMSFTNNTFSIDYTNSWLRWLSGYVEFLGPDGSPVVPDGWVSQVPASLGEFYDSPTKKFVQIFSSVNTILAIPVGANPATISFPWPSNASSVMIYAGGIGRTGGIQGADGKYYGSWDAQVCTPGAVMTGIFNFGIPTACLMFAAAVEMSSLNEIAKTIFSTVLDIAVAIVSGPVVTAIAGGDTLTLMSAFADLIPRLLLDATELAVWMSAEIAEGAAEEATPIFGWIAMAVSIITDVALLAQTSVEVALSPATFEILATRSIDATWTLLPDANHQNTWPLEASYYEVSAVYTDGTTRKTTGQMTSSPQTGPITVYFNQENANRLPAGGTVQFQANFYSSTGWLCGSAKTAQLNADVSGNLLTVPQMNITENLVPLTSTTVYQFDQKLTVDPTTGARVWTNVGGAPTATVADLSSSNIGNNLAQLVNMTISQQTSEIGYTWEASGQNIPLLDQGSGNYSGQMYTFQAIDDRTTPDAALKFVPAGLTAKPLLLFDLDGPSSGIGNNFWVDPRQGLYHIRQVTVAGTGEFNLATGQSWGRFNEQIDSAIVHPTGYVVGVSTANSKLEVLRIGAAAVADADAPLANMYSGYGTRPGLIHIPIGVAALPSAGVVVLEAADSNLPNAGARLQAFDLFGNPAPIFAGSSSVASLKLEQSPVTLLDIAVEAKGYIYVLKYINDGSLPTEYFLDIYNPDGSWLTQTAGLTAAKMNVDLWRTMYTLNFETIVKPDGGRTEPSVSIWLPSTPTMGADSVFSETFVSVHMSRKSVL